MGRGRRWYAVLLCLGIFGFTPSPVKAVTLEESLALAEKSLPALKAASGRVGSSEALYRASLSPYLPALDVGSTQEKRKLNSRSYDLSTYDVTLSYTLFDGGRRRADRNIARLNRDSEREGRAVTLLDLQFEVKTVFFATIARRDILQYRALQVEDSRKDLEVANGRYELEVAKLSDVLQSSVRYEQAKFNRVEAEGELKKALAELNSLLGRSLDTEYDLIGDLDIGVSVPPLEKLAQAVLQRPEIRQAEYSIEKARSNKARQLSEYLPTVTASASYNKSEPSGVISSVEEQSVGIAASWNIFELGKFYRTRAAEFDVLVTRDNRDETVRTLLLDLRKAYEDFITASRNVSAAEEQLKQADHNYAQTFGEYKIGKSDVVALVASEIALANAREQHTTSRLNLILAKTLLERATGVERIESLQTP